MSEEYPVPPGEELANIKSYIKRCDGTLIIDGNDMYDWGWMTIEEHNRQLAKLRMLLFEHIDPSEWNVMIQQARLV